MCTGGARKPTSCANFLRMPLMRSQQFAALRLVDQRDQPVADFQAQRIDRQMSCQLASSLSGAGTRRRRPARAAACGRALLGALATR